MSIAGGNGVDLSIYDNTDNQDLTLSDNTLSLSNDATSVDLAPYLDNTDNQTLQFNGGVLSIAGGNGVDLSIYDNTDNQDLTLSDNTLSLSNDATPVDLAPYLDNTDNQTLQLSGNILSIAGGNRVDLGTYSNTDNQTLRLSGNALTIDNGNTVDLSGLVVDDTDEQKLSLSETELTISNGNTVDLASVIEPLTKVVADLQHTVDSLKKVLAKSNSTIKSGQLAQLSQNYPNPFGLSTTIKYYIPEDATSAYVEMRNINGILFDRINIEEKGSGHIVYSTKSSAPGVYLYTLFVDKRRISTKKFIVE